MLYRLLVPILVSFFCGFLIGIERERHHAQYGARDHIFFSLIATLLIILYENFIEGIGVIIIFIIFFSMVTFLIVGSVYRLFKANVPGYTTALSMIFAEVVGILSYYFPLLAIAVSVIFLIALATKKQFEKISAMQDIEWIGTIEFIAIVLLLFILFPNNFVLFNINIKSIIFIFITILALKYFSYFLLKASTKNNLYYISLLGGLAHSEATTIELAESGASSSAVWLVIQTMLLRMILILMIAPKLLYYAAFPIIITTSVGLVGSFLALRKHEHQLKLEKIKNPLSIKGALVFAGTYTLALMVTLALEFIDLNFFSYAIIAGLIGFLSGGAASLFVTTAYVGGLVSEAQALIMFSIGLTAAIINKIFYSTRVLNEKKSKKRYCIHLIIYQAITISLLLSTTIATIMIFKLS